MKWARAKPLSMRLGNRLTSPPRPADNRRHCSGRQPLFHSGWSQKDVLMNRWTCALGLTALLFAGPSALYGGEVTLRFQWHADQLEYQTLNGFERVSLRDGVLPEDPPGTPWLPARFVNVLLPSGAQVIGVKAVAQETRVRQGMTVYPVQPFQPIGVSAGLFVPPDPVAYAAGGRTPRASAELTGSHTLRGYTFASVRLNAVRYAPAAHELYLATDLALTVTYDASAAHAVSTATPRAPDAFAPIVADLVANPLDVPSCVPPPASTKTMASGSGDGVDYLIITSTALSNSFQALADQRATFNGLKTQIMTTDAIAAAYDGTRPSGGSDLQTSIRNCIIDFAHNRGTLYVVLGGDDTAVPVRACAVTCGAYSESQMPTDLYYAGLDGSWDRNGNGIYGEPGDASGTNDEADLAFDVIVGRIPVRSPSDADGYVRKLVAYERTTPPTVATKMLLCGSKMWDAYANAGRPTDATRDGLPSFLGHAAVSDAEIWLRRLYRDDVQPDWQTGGMKLFTDTLTSWDGPNAGDVPLSSANLRAHFNEGWSHVLVATHGNINIWALETDYFDSGDAASLTNVTAFVYTVACLTAQFDGGMDPCLSEAFLRNANGGALAYLGCSRDNWGSTDPTPAENTSRGGPGFDFAYEFYHRLFQSKSTVLGRLCAEHKAAFIGASTLNGAYRWIEFGLNLQGDPLLALQADDLAVSPGRGLTANGPVQGPFSPASASYVLTNPGPDNLAWTAALDGDWLDLSADAGTLPAGATTTLVATINETAKGLTQGTYGGLLTLSNLTRGIVHSRPFTLNVGLKDYLTEQFDLTTNDLAYHTLTFVPDGSLRFYAPSCEPATRFPVDASGGRVVTLSDDSHAEVDLDGGARVSVFGVPFPTFFIGSNGYLTFDSLDDSYTESPASHFNQHRISASSD